MKGRLKPEQERGHFSLVSAKPYKPEENPKSLLFLGVLKEKGGLIVRPK
jgi:hypothetical protein